VLFGAVLSGLLGDVDLAPALVLAALVVFAIRPAALGVTLSRAEMSWAARGFIGWFGPRGLNSLLLALLVVHADVPGAELLFATVGVVVLASAAVHGASAPLLVGMYARHAARRTLAEEREGTAAGLFAHDANAEMIPRITVEELARQLRDPAPPIVLDVRSRSSYDSAGTQIPGSVRVLPDSVAEWAANMEQRGRLVVAYCT
jgi:NhaP-type Na+/H+ or K+/H+ antiporter